MWFRKCYTCGMNWTDYLYYDETSPSCLRWKVRPAHCISIGDPAGNEKNDEGRIYYQLTLKKRHYYCHRIIWEMFNGVINRSSRIDHIKNISESEPADNRIENLQICSNMQNSQKKLLRRDSKSGFKGVNWNEESKNWMCRITVDGKSKFLGRFDDKIKAAQSYDQAALLYHGEFAITNKSLGLY